MGSNIFVDMDCRPFGVRFNQKWNDHLVNTMVRGNDNATYKTVILTTRTYGLSKKYRLKMLIEGVQLG
jgi:hypothetical protein